MATKLNEILPFEYRIIEARGKAKRSGVLMTLEGVFQRADTQNANKRVYPRSLWQQVMTDTDVSERLQSRRMLGELDHPAGGSTSLNRVSHVITSHTLAEDGTVKGEMDILDTPAGQIAATLFEAGVQLGISSRGDGSVEKKGEVDEVQNDYRLETYDLVLKPSTPGAYPQIIEAEQDKQNVLIASAVEGLVKSTDEIGVLLECHKIISVLEGCESRVEPILALIRQKLGDGRGTSHQTELEETNMSTGNPAPTAAPPGHTLSPEMAAFLKEWVDKGVREAVAAKEAEIAKLNERIVQLTGESKDQSRKMDAAERLIEEFTRKVKDLSENVTGGKDLQQRYDASVRLLDEAITRLQELGLTRRRLHAAESLLAASINRHQNEAKRGEIVRLTRGMAEAVAKKIRPLLAECKSVIDVRKQFASLKSLVESAPRERSREPLPRRRGGKPIVERKDTKQPQPKDFITSRLLARMS
jgi:hypothetical protein